MSGCKLSERGWLSAKAELTFKKKKRKGEEIIDNLSADFGVQERDG